MLTYFNSSMLCPGPARWVFALMLVSLSCYGLRAQDQDSTQVDSGKRKEQKKDTIRQDYRPVSFRFGTDLIAITKTITDKDRREFDLSADVVSHKYLFNVSYGRLEVSREGVYDPQGTDNALLKGESYEYHSEGSYLRLGPDINLLKNDPDKSVLFFGFRYGTARFKDGITFVKQDKTWPGAGYISGEGQNKRVNARWLEATTGLKVKVLGGFWLGYTARFKFALKLKGDDHLSPFDVPGFGRASEKTYWGFNYYLFYTLPFHRHKDRPQP